MKKSIDTENGDKIYFISFHIVQGSLAEDLMHANVFNTSVNELYYSQIKTNFLTENYMNALMCFYYHQQY